MTRTLIASFATETREREKRMYAMRPLSFVTIELRSGLTLSPDQVECAYRLRETMRKLLGMLRLGSMMMYQSDDWNLSFYAFISVHKRTARCYTFLVVRRQRATVIVPCIVVFFAPVKMFTFAHLSLP